MYSNIEYYGDLCYTDIAVGIDHSMDVGFAFSISRTTVAAEVHLITALGAVLLFQAVIS